MSRLDYGTKSPTMDKEPLQRAILAALNEAMGKKDEMIQQITEAMEQELAPVPGGESLAGIERRIEEINQKTRKIVVKAAREGSCARHADKLKMLLDEITVLKEKQAFIEEQRRSHSEAEQRKLSDEEMRKRFTAF